MGCRGLLLMEVQHHDLVHENGVVNKGQSVKVDTSYDKAQSWYFQLDVFCPVRIIWLCCWIGLYSRFIMTCNDIANINIDTNTSH